MDELLPPELLSDAPWSEAELDALLDPEAVPSASLASRQRELDHAEQAAWAMAQVAKLDRRIQEINDQADAYIDRILTWRDELRTPLERRAAFFTERLEHYALAVRQREGIKTLLLPSGDVSTTSRQAKVEVNGDEKLLLAWLHPRLTDAEWEAVANVSVSLRISELRKLLVIATTPDDNMCALFNGERVPEVGVTSAGVTAKVKAAPGMDVARSA